MAHPTKARSTCSSRRWTRETQRPRSCPLSGGRSGRRARLHDAWYPARGARSKNRSFLTREGPATPNRVSSAPTSTLCRNLPWHRRSKLRGHELSSSARSAHATIGSSPKTSRTFSAFDLREMAADAEEPPNRAGDRPMERHGAWDSVPECSRIPSGVPGPRASCCS